MSEETESNGTEAMMGSRDPYAELRTSEYLSNLIKYTDPRSTAAFEICATIEASAVDLGLQLSESWKEKLPRYQMYRNGPPEPVNPEHLKDIKRQLDEKIAGFAGKSFPRPFLLDNLMAMGDILDFDQDSRDALEVLTLMKLDEGFGKIMAGYLMEAKDRLVAVLPFMLDRPESRQALSRIYNAASPLRKNGVIDIRGSRNNRDMLPEFSESLLNKLSVPDLDASEIANLVVGNPMDSELILSDHDHLGRQLDYLVRFIDKAMKAGKKGINVLIWGEPGVGKTAMIATIVQHLGGKLYAIGEKEGEDGRRQYYGDFGPQAGQIRLGELLQAQGLMRKSKNVVLLFDELEDLLKKGTDTSKDADTENKVLLNRTLENNEVLTIWIGNDPFKFHEAVRQRFTHSLYVGPLPTLQRQKVWRRQCEIQGLNLTDVETLELARTYATPPRIVKHAVGKALLVEGGMAEIMQALPSDILIAPGREEPIKLEDRVPANFKTGLIPASDAGLNGQIEALIHAGKQEIPFAAMALGKPGSGAATALRYIAEQSGLHLLEDDMDRLCRSLNPEREISNLFKVASNGKRFLLIHDFERLIAHEQMGKRWNEGLSRTFAKAARAHELPFGVTGDPGVEMPPLLENIFSHRMDFGSLTGKQLAESGKHFFGHKVKGLPGDRSFYIGDFAEASNFMKRFEMKENMDDAALVQMILKANKTRVQGEKTPNP